MRWLIILSLLLQTGVSRAADRWYEIELIVFAYADPAEASELWPALPAEPDVTDAILAPGTIVLPSLPSNPLVPSTRELLRVSTVPPDQYRLNAAYQSLTRSRLYTPILHTAWRQPVGSSGRNPLKVRIAGGKDFSGVYGIDGERLDTGSPPAMSGLWQIDGFVSFRAPQLLFATVDMIFRREQTVIPAVAMPVESDSNLSWQIAAPEPVAMEQKVQFYRMNQSRRVRSGEVQYFDHPMFGVIVEMRPLEPGLEEQLEELTQ